MLRFMTLMAIVLCGLSASAQPVPKTVRHPVDMAAYRAKAMAFLAGDIADASSGGEKPDVSVTLVDLNGDGIPEAFAQVNGRWSCGTRGCSAYVLDLSGPKARSIGDFIAWKLKALPTRTGAWRDVSVNGYRQTFRGGKYGR